MSRRRSHRRRSHRRHRTADCAARLASVHCSTAGRSAAGRAATQSFHHPSRSSTPARREWSRRPRLPATRARSMRAFGMCSWRGREGALFMSECAPFDDEVSAPSSCRFADDEVRRDGHRNVRCVKAHHSSRHPLHRAMDGSGSEVGMTAGGMRSGGRVGLLAQPEPGRASTVRHSSAPQVSSQASCAAWRMASTPRWERWRRERQGWAPWHRTGRAPRAGAHLARRRGRPARGGAEESS